jgi:hypothetical protein
VAAEIRSPAKIAEYLLAAREAQGADDIQFKAIIKKAKLSELLLRRWMEFLERNKQRNDPVFSAWRAYAGMTDNEFASKSAAVTAEPRKPIGRFGGP